VSNASERFSQPRRIRASIKPELISAPNFVVATRDTGYRSTAQAVAELVDNAIQANAKSVAVDVLATSRTDDSIELRVTDDGTGMDHVTLALALTFGGSSRFGDRSFLGRYGMGLPNGALSRARRVDVYTWRRLDDVITTYLDVDAILSTGGRSLPNVRSITRPQFLPRTEHGTVVRLRRCDRLEYVRPSALVKHLERSLGRIFRRFIWEGLDLRVNGHSVSAFDPLFLQGPDAAARPFGDRLAYELDGCGPGVVEVRFSELPVERWHDLSADEKRSRGVSNAACVSILRANREIDSGWYFMGGKRRENYDDWWRCEITFDPSLDELFGMTHAKQSIRPNQRLTEILASDIEPIARALNGRVRRRFEMLKVASPLRQAELQAARAERSLPAIPRRFGGLDASLEHIVSSIYISDDSRTSAYRIVVAELSSTAAFEVAARRGKLILFVNARHPLYRDLLGPMAASESETDKEIAQRLALTILALGRAELTTRSRTLLLGRFRQAWADVLATFLNA
jgi:hypothetical protein